MGQQARVPLFRGLFAHVHARLLRIHSLIWCKLLCVRQAPAIFTSFSALTVGAVLLHGPVTGLAAFQSGFYQSRAEH